MSSQAAGRRDRRARFGLLLTPALLALNACGAQPLLSVTPAAVTVEPNPDSVQQRANVSYTISAPAQVSITLIRPDGESLVLRDGPRAPDHYSLPFSGVVDVPNSPDKQVLPDGNYKIVFKATGQDGRTGQQIVQAAVRSADPIPLIVSNLALTLPTFSPNGQGVRPVPPEDGPPGLQDNLDQTTLDYTISKSSDVFIWAVDARGNRTPLHSQLARDTKAGAQTFIWNGRDPNGMALPDGTYDIRVQASDASGNVSEKSIPVTIVNSGTPDVQIISARFSPTALGMNGVVNVQVTVRNNGDVPIKTIGPPPGTAYTTHMSYLDPSFNKPGDISPPYVDTRGRWRVAVKWSSGPQNPPARWGFFPDDNRELQPGEQVTVNGSIKILPPQPDRVTFSASIEMGGIGFTSQYGQTTVIVGLPNQP